MPEGSGPAGSEPTDSTSGEQLKPLATRRDFLVGAGAGAVAVGVVAGAGVAVTRTQTVTQPGPAVQTPPSGPAVVVPAPPQQCSLPRKRRRHNRHLRRRNCRPACAVSAC